MLQNHNEKGFEAAETIGNLLVENGITKRFPALDMIAIEATHGCHNGVDASFTQRTGTVNGRHASLALGITEPLHKANEIVRRHLLPITMNLL